MRMLSDDSSLAGGVNQRSSSATASRRGWTASHAQVQRTHEALVVAALICAVVGAVVGFHYLLLCALHYCHRRGRVQLVGLKRSALRRLPVTLYNEAEAQQGAAECAICLGEFADGDAVRLLPRCRHGFHVHCIDTWLSAHSSCPICRDSILDEGAAASAGEDTTAWLSAGMLVLPW